MNRWVLWLLVLTLLCISIYGEDKNPRLAMARKRAAQGEYELAIKEYRKLLLESPDNFAAYMEMADVHKKQKKYGLAIVGYKKASELDKQSQDAQLQLAETYELSGQKEKAIQHWRNLAINAANPVFKQKAEDRIAALLKGQKKTGKDTSSIINENEGNKSKSKKSEITSVESKGDTAVKQTDRRKDVKVKVSDNKSNMGDSVKSVAQSAKKILLSDVDPSEKENVNKNEDDPFLKGVALYNQKKMDEALEVMKKVLKKNPKHSGAYYYAGLMRYLKGDYDMALYNLEKGLGYPERGKNANFYLGMIHQSKGDKKRAVQHFAEFIQTTESKKAKKQAESRMLTLKNEITEEEKKQDLLTKEPDVRVLSLGYGLYYFMPFSKDGRFQWAITAKEKWDKNQGEEAMTQLKVPISEKGGAPDADLANMNLATFCFYLGLYERSLYAAQNALEAGRFLEFRPYINFLMSMSLNQLQKRDSALTLLGNIKDDVQYVDKIYKRNLMLDILAKQEKPDEGLAYLKIHKDSALSDTVRAFRYQFALMYLEKNQEPKAVSVLQELTTECGENKSSFCASVVIELGDLYHKNGDYVSAEKYYTKYAELFSDKAEIDWCYYQLGNIQEKKKDYKNAVKWYNTVIKNYAKGYWAKQAAWKKENLTWKLENSEVLN